MSANSTTSARRLKSRGDLTDWDIQVKEAPDVAFRMDKSWILWSDVALLEGSSVKQQGARNARRVLIVDDEEGFRDGVADLLGMEGYEVSVARDAVEAVHVLPAFRPEVILLDLSMPHLDGEGFLRGMSGLPASRGVPVVLISAKEDLPAIASRSGAAAYLQKPFEAPQLLSVLERVLD